MVRISPAPTSTEFSKIVEQYENKYQELEKIYRNTLSNLTKVKNGFGKSEVDSALCPYLLKWGRMGRVLGYKGCYRVGKAINQLQPQLDRFKGTNLLTLNMNQNANDIVDLYDELLNSQWTSDKGRNKRVGPTATAKVLHILLPDTFMIWDREVRNSLDFLDNGSEYLRFLENMQDWNQKLSKTLNSLQAKYGKSCTKLIDEYNWKKAWG